MTGAMFNLFSIISSALMLLTTLNTLFICMDTAGPCGTPQATASFWMMTAPFFLTLPYIKLLWAKNLASDGLVARCAVTSSGLTWAAAVAVLVVTNSLYI